jgi:AcrR family transcriptional regulator
MGSKERRERERLNLKTRILDAAREMFCNEGYESVTMRNLAKRIEYSATAIYLHFKDKESLLAELCGGDLADLDAAMAAVAAPLPPLERMHACGIAFVRFALAHPNQYRLVFMMPKPAAFQRDPAHAGGLVEPDHKAYANLRANFAEIIAAGVLKPGFTDPDMLAQIYFSGLHGIVAIAIHMGEHRLPEWKSPEAQVTAFVDALLQGIKR